MFCVFVFFFLLKIYIKIQSLSKDKHKMKYLKFKSTNIYGKRKIFLFRNILFDVWVTTDDSDIICGRYISEIVRWWNPQKTNIVKHNRSLNLNDKQYMEKRKQATQKMNQKWWHGFQHTWNSLNFWKADCEDQIGMNVSSTLHINSRSVLHSA